MNIPEHIDMDLLKKKLSSGLTGKINDVALYRE